jgi:16S rRNA processing protein RimM
MPDPGGAGTERPAVAAGTSAGGTNAGDAEAVEVVAIGRIGPARGVRGDVFVEPWTDDPYERFVPGSVLRTDPVDAGPVTVESMSLGSGKLVVRFIGVGDRAAAEALRGTRLMIAAADRPHLDDPDDFYDTDLVGLGARTTDGRPLGAVRDVLHAGGADYLVLEVDGQERLVPFVAAIVPTVDLTAGIVEIDPPEGLFDL